MFFLWWLFSLLFFKQQLPVFENFFFSILIRGSKYLTGFFCQGRGKKIININLLHTCTYIHTVRNAYIYHLSILYNLIINNNFIYLLNKLFYLHVTSLFPSSFPWLSFWSAALPSLPLPHYAIETYHLLVCFSSTPLCSFPSCTSPSTTKFCFTNTQQKQCALSNTGAPLPHFLSSCEGSRAAALSSCTPAELEQTQRLHLTLRHQSSTVGAEGEAWDTEQRARWVAVRSHHVDHFSSERYWDWLFGHPFFPAFPASSVPKVKGGRAAPLPWSRQGKFVDRSLLEARQTSKRRQTSERSGWRLPLPLRCCGMVRSSAGKGRRDQ